MPSVFWNLVGFGILEKAMSEELLCIIRWRPTTPEPLPRPSGCRSLAERSSSAAELIAPAATTTTSAEYVSRLPVAVDDDAGDRAPGRVGLQPGDARVLVQQRDVGVAQRRLDAR